MSRIAHKRPNGLLLAAIAGSGTLAMHMFVPALPAVARDFVASPGAAQLTLTVYLIGIAGGQLIYGPLSDRFGRRPVVIVALTLFLLATAVATVAPNLWWLIGARLLQSLGACGGLVLGRAMARDGVAPEQAARRLALLVMVMTVSPALAPLLGGIIGAWVGWRGIFAMLGAATAALLVATIIALPETNHARSALPNPRAMLAVYGRLLRRSDFRAYAIAGAGMSTSIYAFLSASPFLFAEVLHRPPAEVGIYYMTVCAGITLGSWLASRLALRFHATRLLQVAALCGIAGAGGLLAADLAGVLSVGVMLGAMGLFALGCGLCSPLASAQAIGVDPRAIGAASGLYGFIQMSFGALCTLLAGLWHGHSAAPVAGILLASALLAECAFTLVRRRTLAATPARSMAPAPSVELFQDGKALEQILNPPRLSIKEGVQ